MVGAFEQLPPVQVSSVHGLSSSQSPSPLHMAVVATWQRCEVLSQVTVADAPSVLP